MREHLQKRLWLCRSLPLLFVVCPSCQAICPILLEDYRKITVERKGETDFFTSKMIKDCMKKVRVKFYHVCPWLLPPLLQPTHTPGYDVMRFSIS